MPNLRRGYQRSKRLVDLALCMIVLPAILPVLLLCILAVKLTSPGPVFFTQLRTGQHGHRFRMYKFRTMVKDAEALKATYAHLNILPAPDFKIVDDPRVTPLGRFMRKTSLDELPQIFNVLRGEMSLVGPRPTSFSARTYDVWHTTRLEVPPGLTGLWQVKGRNETTFDERLRLDIEYVRTMSLWVDLKILFLTVASVLRRSGA
jgi:lipopolysaccharide/colanic/teichoic acid biosynthesis glycosyltransferase